RGTDNDQWLPAYDLFQNQNGIGQYQLAKAININDILNNALPPQTAGSSFQIKFGEQGITSSNSPFPLFDEDDGYTFDDIKISEAQNDIGVTRILSPSRS